MSKSSRAADVTQSRFSTNCEFFALTRKNEGKPFFYCRNFSVVLPCAPVYRVLLSLNQNCRSFQRLVVTG